MPPWICCFFWMAGRGNLIFEEYGKNKKLARVAEYTYDETNRMVLGVNANGESSAYLFNGLGALVEQTWVIAKNGYGYHDVSAEAAQAEAPAEPQVETLAPDAAELLTPAGVEEAAALAVPGLVVMVNNGQSHGQGNGSNNNDKPTGTDVKKTSTVVKDFVVDYTSATRDPLMEYEINGLDYRYVYGNERLSVNVTGIENGSGHIVENGNQIRLYYHTDLRGTFDYLTSPVSQKVESWTHYNEWGEITHNAVLKCDQRELDLVKNYTGHDFDSVLSQYYAKARMYDAGDRRFTSVDPVLNPTRYDVSAYVASPAQFVPYLYVVDNPLVQVDPLGTITIALGGEGAVAFLARISLGGQLVFDGEGRIGIMAYAGAGGGFPAASVTSTLTVTNAPTIWDLASFGAVGGGSATVPVGLFAGVGLGFEVLTTGQYFGLTASLGAGTSLPELHGEVTYSAVIDITGVLKFFGIYDDAYQLLRDYYNQLNCD